MEKDQIQTFRPALQAIVSYWQSWLPPEKNPRMVDRLFQIGEKAWNDARLRQAATLGSIAQKNLPPLSAEQRDQFGLALHEALVSMLQRVEIKMPNVYLSALGESEFEVCFGVDYDLQGVSNQGGRSLHFQDSPLFYAANAIGIDPQALKLYLPWKTWTVLRYGTLVPRALVREQERIQVLSPDWMIHALNHIQSKWQRSSLSPQTEDIEAIQQVDIEDDFLRISLLSTHYKIRPGARLGRQTYLAVIDVPVGENVTFKQAKHVQRTLVCGETLSDLLVLIVEQNSSSLPLLQTVS